MKRVPLSQRRPPLLLFPVIGRRLPGTGVGVGGKSADRVISTSVMPSKAPRVMPSVGVWSALSYWHRYVYENLIRIDEVKDSPKPAE